MIAALGHNRPPSYRATYLLGRPDLEFGADYRERVFAVRDYDDYFDGHLTYRDGKGQRYYAGCITVIRLSDGHKWFFRKRTACFDTYENTDAHARERLGLSPKVTWGAR